ncbi:iron ABC transporter permease [Chryseoglobus sp. 28M-23]|uniref:FecCD family ABC transporter permease n=1 Tax=Chryseoglobus sp. 28M-23 TaxID=2772253 RepID=UPI001746BA8F|nr:iron ABC transporter permease [Chryseoglobus sp. 28M-23]QOD93734.1 iron ABC transporter permease [Chryseoglobus sp. 28M-23]
MVLLLLVCLTALSVVALGAGAVPVPPVEVAGALLGLDVGGSSFIVLGLRLPRLLLALLAGAALGLAGALLQSVVRNPLASPDIVGITGGASATAVLAIAGGASGWAVSGAALGGALGAAAVVFLASGRGVAGARFVVVGIAVAFLAQGVLGFALTRASLVQAESAYFWLVGSVGSPSDSDLLLLAVTLAVVVLALVLGAHALSLQAFDDDTARALGGRPVATRVLAIAGSSILAAIAVAVTGPIAFVAFVSGPLARRMRGRGPALATAALTGALIVLAADLVSQNLLPGSLRPPVGLITGALGAPFLLWILVRGERGSARSRARLPTRDRAPMMEET